MQVSPIASIYAPMRQKKEPRKQFRQTQEGRTTPDAGAARGIRFSILV